MYPSGPLFSLILIVFAGIALRYALWYGKDDRGTLSDSGADELRERTRTLQDAVDEERSMRTKLAADLERTTADYDALKFAIDQRETEWHAERGTASELEELVSKLQAEGREQLNQIAGMQDQLRALESQRDMLYSEIESTRADAANLGEERQQVSAALETSAQTRAELEKQLKASMQQVDDVKDLHRRAEEKIALLEADVRFADDLREEQGQLKTSLHETTNRIRSIHVENESLSIRAIRAEERADSGEKRVAELQALVDSQTLKLGEQAERMASYAEQLQKLGAQADEKVAELHNSYRSQLDTLRGEQTEHAQVVGTRFESEMEALRAGHAEEVLSLRMAHDDEIESLRAATEEEILKVRSSSELEIVQLRTREHALTNKLIELEQQMDGVRDVTSSLESETNEVRLQRDAFATELAQAKQQVLSLQAALDSQTESLRVVAAQKGEAESESSEVRSQRDSFATELAQAKQQVLNLQTALDSQAESLRVVAAEKDEVVHGLLREREQRTELETKVADATRRADENADAVETLRRLRDDYSRLETRHSEIQTDLRRIDDENREFRSIVDREERRNDDLSQRLETERGDLLATLDRERKARETAERAVRVHTDALERLRADSESMESLLERQTVVQSSLKEHTDRLQEAVRDVSEDRAKILSFPGREDNADGQDDQSRSDAA